MIKNKFFMILFSVLLLSVTLSNALYTEKIDLRNSVLNLNVLYTAFPSFNTPYVNITCFNCSGLNASLYYPASKLKTIKYYSTPASYTANPVINGGSFNITNSYIGYNSGQYSAATGGRCLNLELDFKDSYYINSTEKILNLTWEKYGVSSSSIAANVKLFYNDVYLKTINLNSVSSPIQNNYTQSDFLYDYTGVFNQMVIFYCVNGHSTPFFSDLNEINFQYLYTGTDLLNNPIPVFNITQDKQETCINTTETAIINLNYSIYDNDTIYYAFKSNYINGEIKKDVDFSTDYTFLGIKFSMKKTDSLQSGLVYKDSNTCRFNSTSKYKNNNNQYNTLENVENFMGIQNTLTDYFLRLNTNCFGSDKYFYYELETYLDYVRYYGNVYFLGSGDGFNITYFDNDFNVLDNYKIQRSNDLIQMYNRSGGLLYNAAYISIPKNNYVLNDLSFIISKEFNQTYININYDQFVTNNDLNGSVAFIGILPVSEIAAKNVSIFLKDFYYNGIYSQNVLNFSLNQKTNFSYQTPGEYAEKICISDNLHQPSQYSCVDLTFFVGKCSVFTQENKTDYFIDVLTEENIKPKFPIPALNNIIALFRIPAFIMYNLGVLGIANIISIFTLLYFLVSNMLKKLEEHNQETDEIIKNTFVRLFLMVFILQFLFLIGNKSVFVTISVLGLLFLGSIINKLFNIENTINPEQQIFLSFLWFGVLSYLFFGFMQINTSFNYGIPSLNIPSVYDFASFLTAAQQTGQYIINALFFEIPLIPDFLNFIIVIMRSISIFALIFYLYEKLNPMK